MIFKNKENLQRGGGFFILLFLLLWFLNFNSTPPISELAKNIPTKTLFSASIIPDTDLPPEGTRSLFDHIIAQNGVLPYPYEKLVELIYTLSPDNKPIDVLIPNGRSLLKGQADNAHPRIVTAADSDSKGSETSIGLAMRGRLFLGFVEKASEIEVLSYNEAAGRFEFQLVQNYCEGCTPKIVYARRAICTTCHQGATPIFSQRPWNETNGQPETSNAILSARKNSESYHNVPIFNPLSSPERYDQLTDVGNFFVATQKIWLDGCGENGFGCRREMLALAFEYMNNAGSFNTNGPAAEKLKKLQEVSFPKENIHSLDGRTSLTPIGLSGSFSGIPVPESDLLNRDPLGEKLGFKGWIRSLFTREIKFGEGAKDNEDLGEFEKLPPLRKELDPLNIRHPKKVITWKDIDGVFGVASFFTDDDFSKIYKYYSYDINKITTKIRSLPDSFFSPKPFSRIDVIKFLTNTNLDYSYIDTSEMSPPIASGVPPLEIKEFPELKLYSENCFACHRGNPAKKLNFMAGNTEKEVLENIKAKTEIRDSLDWERYENTEKANKLMPPRDSKQYEILLSKGNESTVVLKKMRDVVPGLFDF
jgi:hypothetical protein